MGTHHNSPPPLATSVPTLRGTPGRPNPPTTRAARAVAAAASQQGRILRSAIVAILATLRHSTPVRVVPVN